VPLYHASCCPRPTDDDFYLDASAACASDTAAAGAAAFALTNGQQGLPSGLLFLPSDPSATPAGQQAQQAQQAQQQAQQQQQQAQQRQSAPPPANPQQQAEQAQQQQAQQAQRQWGQLAADLRCGTHLAAAVRAAAKQQLGITLSCGVARNKLLARLASPCGKPDGLAVVPDEAERAFIAQLPLRKVPQLR